MVAYGHCICPNSFEVWKLILTCVYMQIPSAAHYFLNRGSVRIFRACGWHVTLHEWCTTLHATSWRTDCKLTFRFVVPSRVSKRRPLAHGACMHASLIGICCSSVFRLLCRTQRIILQYFRLLSGIRPTQMWRLSLMVFLWANNIITLHIGWNVFQCSTFEIWIGASHLIIPLDP